MSSPWDPRLILSIVGLAVDLALLAVLYIYLPKTAKTGHARYMLRFAMVWAFGDVGVRWSVAQGYDDSVLRIVCEVVALVGMVSMSALWTHLAWLTTMDLEGRKRKDALDIYQLAVYIAAVALIGIGFALRNGLDLGSRTFTVLFDAWFMACVAWSIVRFTGPGYDGAPAIEQRSRQVLAAGTAVMFFLVLIDMLQTITGMPDLALATGLQFVPMAVLSWGFLLKSKFIVEPVPMPVAKGSKAAGGGFHLSPGKLYMVLHEGPEGKGMALDLMRGQARRGRPILVFTDRKPLHYQRSPKLGGVPVARYISEGWDGPGGIDIISKDELAMVPWMAKEFALESWMVDKEGDRTTGSAVIIDDAHVLSRVAGKDGTRNLLKGLAKAVKGSDQLRVVVLADKAALGKRARLFERYGTPLEAHHV